MKNLPICRITTVVLLTLTNLPAYAGKEVKESSDSLVERLDTNNNRKIEGKEVGAVRKAYQDEKTGALQQFDSNRDGELSDAEIAAIQLHKATPEPKLDPKGKKKKNKVTQKAKKK